MLQAQPVRFAGSMLAFALIILRLVVLTCAGLNFFEKLGVHDGRTDSVSAARPFAQINQAATIATKRELLIRTQHNVLARGTTQAECLLACHTELDDTRDQIVVVRFRNFTFVELTACEFIVSSEVVDEDLAVDLRSVQRGTSFPKKVRLL
jgi:hypothetical protein